MNRISIGYLYPMVLDVPLDDILPVSPASTLKFITSGVLSNVISFLCEVDSLVLPCDSLFLKKNGILLAIPRDGGDVKVELDLDEAFDS